MVSDAGCDHAPRCHAGASSDRGACCVRRACCRSASRILRKQLDLARAQQAFDFPFNHFFGRLPGEATTAPRLRIYSSIAERFASA